MGQGDSKLIDGVDTETYIRNQLQALSGEQILEQADDIQTKVRVRPVKRRFNFGEKVEGQVSIELNKPLNFIQDGYIQVALEGREQIQVTETKVTKGSSQRDVVKKSVKANHQQKFYRVRQVLFDSKNVSDVMDMRLNSALQNDTLEEYNDKLSRKSETSSEGYMSSDSESFLEAGTHTFPFNIELDTQQKKPPSFSLTDLPILKEGE